MATAEPVTTDLKASLEGSFARVEKSHPYFSVRQKAMQVFSSLGFPTTRHEEWKYTRLAPLTRIPFLLAQGAKQPDIPFPLAGRNFTTLVFVNGQFAEKLSDRIDSEKIKVISLKEAMTAYPSLMKDHFTKLASFEEEPLVALNTALAQDGAFIYVDDHAQPDKPVHLVFVTGSEEPVISFPRNLVVLGRNSKAVLVESILTDGTEKNFSNPVTEIMVKENASLHYYKIQNAGENTSQVDSTCIKQEKSSSVSTFTFTIGGKLHRNNLTAVLAGEDSETHLFGLSVLNDAQHADHHTAVDHAVPHCFSNELYKSILDRRSEGVFNGKIFVRKDAQKTNAFQSNKTVLLSDDAKMNTKPQLEIFADDVKCSHGATIGQLDADALFYLRARGIGEAAARALLVRAFAGDVLDKIETEEIKSYVEELVQRKLDSN